MHPHKDINIGVIQSPPGPKSRKMLQEIRETMARTTYTGLYGITLLKGYGPYIEDVDGNIFLDCFSGASSCILGYQDEMIRKAFDTVSKELQFSGFGYSPNIYVTPLARKLISLMPGDFDKRVILGLTGSDAVSASIEVMRKFTGRFHLLHFKHAYHGSTALAQKVSDFDLKEGIYKPSPYYTKVDFPEKGINYQPILMEVEKHLETGNYGGFLIEPVQGDSGVHLPEPGFFPELRQLLDRYDALLIDDEVQAGLGRCGPWWAIEEEKDVEPDIILVGKGLSAGYVPISALIGRADVVNSLDPAQQAFTFSGHPPSAHTALKVIEKIENEGLRENVKRQGEKLLAGFKQIGERFPDVIKEVRGRGLMIGIEINISNDPYLAKILARMAVEKGVYFGYFGLSNEVVRVQPPFIISNRESNTILEVTDEVVSAIAQGKIPGDIRKKVLKYAMGMG